MAASQEIMERMHLLSGLIVATANSRDIMHVIEQAENPHMARAALVRLPLRPPAALLALV
jgi:DNA gyrase/topoisomerase IV subunit A